MKRVSLALAAIISLAGCSAPTVQTEAAYAIYDGPATPTQQLTEKLLSDITAAVQEHVSDARITKGVPPVTLPAQPGNFALKNPYAGSANLNALAQMSGTNLEVPTCEQPIMTMNSNRSSVGEKSTLFVCVMPFESGYRTAIYASFSRRSGFTGNLGADLGTAIGRAIAGDINQYIPTVMANIKKSMQNDLGGVNVVKSYIPDSFKGPLADDRDTAQK